MDETKLAEQLARSFAEFTGVGGRDAKQVSELINSLKRLNEVVKENNKRNTIFSNIIKGQTESYQNLEDAHEDYQDALKKARTLQETLNAKEAYDSLLEEAARKNVRAALTNFSLGTITLTKNLVSTVATATQELVKNIQSGGTGVSVGTSTLKTGLEIFKTTANAASGALGGVGSILRSNANPALRGLGMFANLAGGALGKFAAGLTGIARFGIEVLSQELTKNIESYNVSTTAGALFARGITELREAAHQAGMSVATMANIVKINSDTLYTSGMDIGSATKMISDVFVKGGKEFKVSLFNLGYSLEEQGALVAETMKYLSVVGRDVSSLSSETIRKETEKYAINLKTISAITGEDAKKRIEESRQMAANAAIQAELAKMTPEAQKRFLEDLSIVPKQLQQAVLQQRVLGTVVDRNVNILMTSMPEAANLIRGFSSGLGQGTDVMGKLREEMAQSIRSFAASGQASAFGISAMAGVTGTATDFSNFFSELTLLMQQGAKRMGDTDVITEKLSIMATTTDNLTGTLSNLQVQTGLLSSAVEKAADPGLQKFGTALEFFNNQTIGALTKAGELLAQLEKDHAKVLSGIRDQAVGQLTNHAKELIGGVAGGVAGFKLGNLFGRQIGRIFGRFIGGLAGSFLGPLGMVAGGLAGDFLGNKLVELFSNENKNMGSPEVQSDDLESGGLPPAAAKGAVLKGPTSGFAATLHGTEAVVPLPDGRTIPVSLTLPKEMANLNYVPPTVNDTRTFFSQNLNIDKLTAEITKIKQAAEDIKQASETQELPLEIKRTIEMSNNSLKEVLREQIDLMRDSNNKFQQLMDIASDTRNINRQILNTAY